MESDNYQKHFMKNLVNKKSQYMPSISSISDLSMDGKNKRWSRRWESGLQDGAENPYDEDYFDYKSESDTSTSKESEKNEDNNDNLSVSVSSRNGLGSKRDNDISNEKLQEYKNIITDLYDKTFQKKHKGFEKPIESQVTLGNKTESGKLEHLNYKLIGDRIFKSQEGSLIKKNKVLKTKVSFDSDKESEFRYTRKDLEEYKKSIKELYIDAYKEKNKVAKKGSSETSSESTNLKHKKLAARDLENFKNNIREFYQNLYGEKIRELKDQFQTKTIDKTEDPDLLTKTGLTGLGFWPSYNETIKEAVVNIEFQDKNQDSLYKEISKNCYDLDTKKLCSSCKYNHIKDCANALDSKNKVNSVDVIVKNSDKLIDSFTVNLDPKGHKKLFNSINISIKSNRCCKMDSYDSSKKCIKEDIVPPKETHSSYSIEPPFSQYETCKYSFQSNSDVLTDTKCVSTFIPNKVKPDPSDFSVKFNDFKNDMDNKKQKFCVYKKKDMSQRNVEFDVPKKPELCSVETLKTQKSHFPTDSSFKNENKLGLIPNSNINSEFMGGNSRFSRYDRDPQSNSSNPNINRVNSISHRNNEFDGVPVVSCSFETEVTPKDISCGMYRTNCSGTFDNFGGYSMELLTPEVRELINSGPKMHVFKINNKGINIPLFLNIGGPESVYSGQAFLSNTVAGLFKISVVEPIEPKVSFGNKLGYYLGLNGSKIPYCKCESPLLQATKNWSFNKETLNGVWNTFTEYVGSPWNYSQSSSTPLGNSKTKKEVNVCDFHKNLINKKVDRSKFGKDVYCQLKFMNGLGLDLPVSISKRSFTKGSNVSSFFNGFHEQLLCIQDTRDLGKFELYNNHNFTFILRELKGCKGSRNFTILNTTSGHHLCIDLLTNDLKFEEESKFTRFLVPAIFKILSLPNIVEDISKNLFKLSKTSSETIEHYNDNQIQQSTKIPKIYTQKYLNRYPTHMSTTDQYLSMTSPVLR